MLSTLHHIPFNLLCNTAKDTDIDLSLIPILKIRRQLKGHFGKVYALEWAGNGTDLVSASQDGKLIVWNGMQNVKLQAIPLRSSWVMTCSYEQTQGGMVACGGLDNLCTIYQLNKEPVVTRSHRELTQHDGYLSSCKFVDSNSILTASGDSNCILWDIELGQAKITFRYIYDITLVLPMTSFFIVFFLIYLWLDSFPVAVIMREM